jgi:hypothetical protein
MNNTTDYLTYLIQRHEDLGELGVLYWNLGNYKEGNEYFTKADEVWNEFQRVYNM